MGWRSVLPNGVKRYSIATGRELRSSRSMMPLRSRRSRVAVSNFCESCCGSPDCAVGSQGTRRCYFFPGRNIDCSIGVTVSDFSWAVPPSAKSDILSAPAFGNTWSVMVCRPLLVNTSTDERST